MEDFLFNNLGKIIIVLIIGFLSFMIWGIWYESTHCLSGHLSGHNEMRYYPPTFMFVDKILIPIGGGMYNDFICDKWKK